MGWDPGETDRTFEFPLLGWSDVDDMGRAPGGLGDVELGKEGGGSESLYVGASFFQNLIDALGALWDLE